MPKLTVKQVREGLEGWEGSKSGLTLRVDKLRRDKPAQVYLEDGRFILDGKEVGKARARYLEDGTVDFEHIYLPPDLTGKGAMQEMFRDLAVVYRGWGMERAVMRVATRAGRAFAEVMGFTDTGELTEAGPLWEVPLDAVSPPEEA